VEKKRRGGKEKRRRGEEVESPVGLARFRIDLHGRRGEEEKRR
jgi:hypothetical protein